MEDSNSINSTQRCSSSNSRSLTITALKGDRLINTRKDTLAKLLQLDLLLSSPTLI